MKTELLTVLRYDADEGKVFDWVDLASHISTDEDGNEVQDHLYAKTVFVGKLDSIDNYIEVDAPSEEE